MGKIYLIAGHTIKNGKGTGAHSQYGDEAVEAVRLRDAIAAHLAPNGYDVVVDPNTTRLGELARKLRSVVSDKDMVVDIHFNAATPQAHGTEVFIDDTPTTRESIFASNMVQAICYTLGTRNRGVKKESQTRHGTLGIISIPSSACNILLEICFLTNKNDMAKYRQNFDKLAECIAVEIAKCNTELEKK